MKKRISALILTLIFAFSCIISVSASSDMVEFNVSGKRNYNYAAEVLKIVNEQRVKNGLSTVTMDEDLQKAAMYRAAEISVFFSHTRPNGESCFSLVDWERSVGENIAYGQRNAKDVMNAWMNSEGHRQNILTANFKSLGVGCFIDSEGMINWVQIFDAGNPIPATKSGTENVTETITALKSNVSESYYTKPSTTTTKPTTNKKPSTSKSTALKKASFKLSVKKGKVTVQIKKDPNATAYQIKFKQKSAKKWQSFTFKSRTIYINKLKKGKKYNVKVRAVKKSSKKTVYGKFSKTKTFKAK